MEDITVWRLGDKWGDETDKHFFPMLQEFSIVICDKQYGIPAKGDVVLIHRGMKCIAMAIVISEYVPCKEFPQELKAEFQKYDVGFEANTYVAEADILNDLSEADLNELSHNSRKGESRINKPEIRSKVNEILKRRGDIKKMSELENKYAAILENCHNLVLTGAPGTGKTYLAWQIAYKLTGDNDDNHKHIAFCQFHPSMDYTDFVEGLRPDSSLDSDSIGFSLQDGIFKEFCKDAVFSVDDDYDEAYAKLIEKIGDSDEFPIVTKRGVKFRVKVNSRGNLTFFTKDNVKPTGTMTKEKIRDFHYAKIKSYWSTYFNGIWDYLEDNGWIHSQVQKTEQKYVFIIDEINRGDISKIFGELFYAIDPGYRGNKKYSVKTTYWKLLDDSDVFKQGFYVPENVYIIGTMNDIDRSVESMDFAIRRRFTWLQVNPEETIGMLDADSELSDCCDLAKESMKSLNEVIKAELPDGDSYQIGAAYFKRLGEYKELAISERFTNLWTYHLQPLLSEYLRGIPEKQEILEKFTEAYNKPLLKDSSDKDKSADGSNRA